jgi:hypothetical protein
MFEFMSVQCKTAQAPRFIHYTHSNTMFRKTYHVLQAKKPAYMTGDYSLG